jgi:hypothetical protein
MSLLEKAFEDFTFINKAKVDDGLGGYAITWTDGATIKCAVVMDSSLQARTALANGVTSIYTMTTLRQNALEFHDVLRRESDGKIFRVTSDGDDKKTPKGAGLDMRQVSCEEWTLPKEAD